MRCDASTMTQNDIDNGRLIAQVTFHAASTVELIHVTLALETSGAQRRRASHRWRRQADGSNPGIVPLHIFRFQRGCRLPIR